MFEFWKERGLRRRIIKLEERYIQHLTGSIHFTELDKAGREFLAERESLLMELEILDADQLKRTAGRYGLDSLPQQETYEPQQKGAKPRLYFRPAAKAQLIKMISEARYNWWRKWIDLFVPLLSLIVAALALFKDIITTWLTSK